ncbi:uncharacterized protein ASPGLDRAFT_1169782 [Aspergillus glaucus CBS 516.65]|uniref:Uncharacterized protein n=1 Tax=Aspergillus glaucus CBS 516.65 TaxID=1160497 RepID=A0A1L9VU19_ASPGL|nr:hypothetical protein ASPGLDRAFT_1169782 [Aspergillus glaucus CBS 516.65]OJJ87394.1 hypothetical protein ASPGLDRAFT_1169782 [Aspergillus glaucus CBS 516.65]
MKFTGIAAMLAVVTAVTGAAIPNVNGALAEVHQVTGDVQGLLSKALGTKDEAQVNKLVSQLQSVEKALKNLSSGEEKRQLLDVGVGANVNVKRDEGLSDIPLVGDLLQRDEGLVDLPVVDGLLRRDDAISGLAEQITPQVTKVVQDLNVQQVTGLLNVLNVNGLLTNVESVLDNLLGGGLLKGLTGGLLGDLLKRDDAISRP